MTCIESGVTTRTFLRNVLDNEALWEIGERLPAKEPGTPGAPREHPEWTWILFAAAVSVYRSARKATAELSEAWPDVVAASRSRYPARADLWAVESPPRRHQWQYAKKRITDRVTLADAVATFEAVTASQVTEMGLDGTAGSLTHPDATNVVTGDGKVITPMFRAKPGTPVVDTETGEILRYRRYDPDAQSYTTGDKKKVYGNKFVMLAWRQPDWHSRMVLSLDYVSGSGGEAQAAVECAKRTKDRLPGIQAIVYDGAFRGTHVQQLLRDASMLTVSPPTAERAGGERDDRVEKQVFLETVEVDGIRHAIYGQGGQPGTTAFDVDGNGTFEPLRHRQTIRRTNFDGTSRWYGVYDNPTPGGAPITLRADTTEADRSRGVNRSENLRLIPQGSADYERLYPMRSDIEANNRQLEDTLWINRAHSVGARGQLLDLLGYALVYNSLAVGLHRQRVAQAQAA